LKTFVANCVAKIQHTTPPELWRHVPTAQNLADCASRGVTPKYLVNHPLWWHGPEFFAQPSDTWPPSIPLTPLNHQLYQSEEKLVTLLTAASEEECQLLHSSSELPKVLRLTVYWLRVRKFITKHQTSFFDHTQRPEAKEKEEALHALLKWVQRTHFEKDLKRLALGQICSTKLRLLKSYLDPEGGLLWVGGRL